MQTKLIKKRGARLDIADHLGLRVETLSRLLTKLKRQQLIDLPDANTVVLNHAASEFLDTAGDVGGYIADVD